MEDQQDGRFDERLLMIVMGAGAGLLALFLVTPVLRPYYAVLMPVGILVSSGAALWLLRSARAGDEAERRQSEPSTTTAGGDE